MVESGLSLKDSIAPVRRVLLVGDSIGVPRLLRHVDKGLVCGIAGAVIRPQYHDQLRELAATRGVPFLVQPRNTDSEIAPFLQAVAELSPDMIVCDSYSMMLGPDFLGVARAGAVNVHGGLVPRYRGANPIQWMLINDESDAGVSIHYMDAGFDSGPLIAQRSVPVTFSDTWNDVLARVNTATEELLAAELPAILSLTASATPQDESTARSFPHRKPADGRIEWSKSVREIYNLVRALVAPLPGAFYEREGVRVVLDRWLGISDVARLKQDAIGGGFPTGAGGAVRVRADATDDNFVLVVVDQSGGQNVVRLTDLDYMSRHGRAESPSLAVREFAARELGILDLA